MSFGPFEFDRAERLLLRDGQPIMVPPKAFDVLALLVERAGHLVTKDELLAVVWPGVVVEENVLSVAVSRLRSAMGEEAKAFIRAVPGYGYRFVASVIDVDPADVSFLPASDGFADGPRAEDVVATLSGDGTGPASDVLPHRARPLAISPFNSHDPEAAPIAAGLADALVAALVRLGVSAHVVGPGDPSAALVGDVQVAGGRARAVIRVGARGPATWARTFTASAVDPLVAQDELAAQAAEALSLRASATARLRTDGPPPAVGPTSYHRARYLIERRMLDRAGEALAAFEAAAEAEPYFAPAWTGIAEVCVLLPYLAGAQPRDAFPRARAAAERALALTPDAPEPLVPLAHVAWRYDWDAPAAERMLREAIDRSPSLALAHQALGLLLVLRGSPDEGFTHLHEAQRLMPDVLEATMEIGYACFFSRRYEEALTHLHSVLGQAPGYPMAHLFVGLVLDAQGNPEAGLTEIETAVHAGGPHPVALATLARAYARCGRADDARAVLADVERSAAASFAPPTIVAPALDALGEQEEALNAPERAVAVRDPMLAHLGAHPHFDPMRDEPRFRAVALRLGSLAPARVPVDG